MKQLIFSILWLAVSLNLSNAQNEEPYEFKEYKRAAATSVKSQDQTGTCWAFSTASFLESEALRLGKGTSDLSEMYVVRNIYRMKCENYVRRQGTAQFGEGGLSHDMLMAVKKFGIVPESIYPGRIDGTKPFNHSKLEKALKEKCVAFAQQGKEGKLAPNWLKEIDALLDQEFGPLVNKFNFEGKAYTPQSYRDSLGINPDDYVTITSFTHHPFWGKFILEIPDNWSNGEFYNLPLDDMIRCATHAIEKGYTIEWDADVSNMGFSANNGIAIVPKTAWKDKSAAARTNAFKVWEPEQKISQEYRQQLFDSQETMDDHLMHVVGVLDEKHSGIYFVVKNSWGEISDFKGYVYVSHAYMELNTISFTLPKTALPQDVRRRLGFEAGEVNIEKSPASGMGATPANKAKSDTQPQTINGKPHLKVAKKEAIDKLPKE
jgi:bleomycin hydrolase